jgi:hypothetical protein
MTSERKLLLNRVNELIDKKKNELLKYLPNIHKIEDGIMIRTFYDWVECDENIDIKYKKILNINKPDDISYFYYLPKETELKIKGENYVSYVTCLTGKIKLEFDNKSVILEPYSKTYINDNEFYCRALENTYIITTNMK